MIEAAFATESVDYIEGNVPAYWAEVQFRRASNFKFRFDLVDATARFARIGNRLHDGTEVQYLRPLVLS